MSRRTPHGATTVSPVASRVTTSDARLQVEFHRVYGGVVVGRIQTDAATCRIECWGLVTSIEQFTACSALDDIRFAHPLMHARLLKEFRNAYDEPAPAGSAATSRPQARLPDAGD